MSLQPGIASAKVGSLDIDYDFHQAPLAHGIETEPILSRPISGPQLTLRVTPRMASTSQTPMSLHSHNRGLLRQASTLVAHVLAAIVCEHPRSDQVALRLQRLAKDPHIATLQERMRFDANGGSMQAVYEADWQLHMIVRERTIVHIQHMPTQQRSQLQEGVEHLKQTPLQHDPLLKQIDHAIKESVLRDVCQHLQPTLEDLLARAANHTLSKDDANQGFVGLKESAEGILQRSGFADLPPPNDAHTLRQILVEGLIGKHIDNNAIHRGDASAVNNVVAFFSQLSLSSLGSFFSVRKADPDHSWLVFAGHNPFLFAQANISSRIRASVHKLTPLVEALSNTLVALEEPKHWLPQTKAVSNHLKQAKKIEKLVQHYLPSLSLPFAGMRHELGLMLNDLRHHHRSRIRHMPAAHLQALQRLAKVSEHHSIEHFLERMVALQPIEKIYTPLLARGFARAVEGDLLGLFQHLSAANSLAQKSLRHQPMRRLYANATDIFYDLYQLPVSQLSDEYLLKLHAILYDTSTLQVLDAIVSAGQSILSRHGYYHVIDSHKVKQCADCNYEFALLQQATAHALQKRGLLPLPMRMDIAKPSASKILEHSFGIHIGNGKPEGYTTTHQDASAKQQTLWQQQIARFVPMTHAGSTTPRPSTQLPSGVRLDPTFIKELHQLGPIHAHTYTDKNAHSLPLVNKPTNRTQSAQNAYDTLADLGASAAAIEAASHCAHHAIFDKALLFWPTEDAVLASPVPPVFTNAITHFHFSAAPDQGIFLRVEYGAYLYRPAQVNDDTHWHGDFPHLTYFHLCSKLQFDAQGIATIAIPLKVTVKLVEDAQATNLTAADDETQVCSSDSE